MGKTFVIYHKNCADGFGAAHAAWTKLGDRASYFPMHYGDPLPVEVAQGRDGDVLYLVDFSLPEHTLMTLVGQFGRIYVLDHHKTAIEGLASFTHPAVELWLDPDKSGAVLAYEHFHPVHYKVPRIYLYIQDRDLWRWELPHSREISAALASIPMEFEEWSEFGKQLEDEITRASILAVGSAIRQHEAKMVISQANSATIQVLKTPEEQTYAVPTLNATVYISEIGNELCKRHPQAPFAATFFVRGDGKRQWSLRSIGEFDVSAIAKQFGGGGHRNAAGFTTAS